ncbi:hypothetical protein [Synechococcus sp. NOUM97013]|uniref:hypothetical protein n=1 Tax=Synechococcus sp. NOUM97013 TaxID=1442555 RepID=UPI001645FC22|nr:hypothetical protein [Synechococcus sp. NOUM97013]
MREYPAIYLFHRVQAKRLSGDFCDFGCRKKYQTYVTGLSLITGMRFDALIRVVIVGEVVLSMLVSKRSRMH